jgi:hypothetical protein
MQRPRDFADEMEKEIRFYNEAVLKPLEVGILLVDRNVSLLCTTYCMHVVTLVF